MNGEAIRIFYDGECPFCSRYVRYLNLRESFGAPELVDVRVCGDARRGLADLSFDIDKGMVVQVGERYFHGHAAVNVLAMMSGGHGGFNRFNKAIFSSRFLSWVLYPFMVFFRNLTLVLLGRGKVGDVGGGGAEGGNSADPFYVFAWAWAFYTVFHFCYWAFYAEDFGAGLNDLSWVMVLLAGYIVVRPGSSRVIQVFSVLVVVQLCEMWLQMPTISNHAMLGFLFSVAMGSAGVVAVFRQYSVREFFDAFAPAGRWLLVIMYFYGIFHKINADFLNPEASCAVALWLEYPFPAVLRDGLWAHYAAIYMTFIVEGFVMVALFFRRGRYFAIVVGCGFHLLLGLSPYAFYGAFSLISFALHMLFLPAGALESFRQGRVYRVLAAHQRVISASLAVCIAAAVGAAIMHDVYVLIVLFLGVAGALFVFVVMSAGSYRQVAGGDRHPLYPNGIAVFIGVVFFLNNAAPYMGLKTHQSMNMFSNLHLEGGRSNHLILSEPPSLFSYLDETVEILAWRIGEEDIDVPSLHVVYHDFLVILQENKGLVVTYKKDGEVYRDVTFGQLEADFDRIVLPPFFRKFVFFTGADYRQPKECVGFK